MKIDMKKTVNQFIKDQMSKASKALSHDQRVRNGRKSWLTRRANLAKTLKST